MKFNEVILSEKLRIREIFNNELEKAFPVISQLRTNLNLEEYIKLVETMKNQGYKIICLFEDDKVVSYAGIIQLVNLYYEQHIWVCDLVTDKNKRSNGYGKLLLAYIEQYAQENSLNCVALSSGLLREDAHKFYEHTMDYDKTSYVFKKNV